VRRLMDEATEVTLDEIVALCKRRGFIFQASEIYGGFANTYDYGHYGVLLKNNVKAEWWRAMLQERDDIVAIDSAIIQHPRVWEASGHLEGFTDPLVQCLGECKRRWREDDLREQQPEGELRCPVCGGELSEPRRFNLMFETQIGPVQDDAAKAYLRHETAQGIFIDFRNVLQFARRRPPFGIAQIGKSFRNEITPGNFIFRTREFEQMEMEFFVEPGTDERWHDYWIEERFRWYTDLGMRADQLRLREHEADELSHYAKRTVDVEYRFPFTDWGELEGIANRADFDLKQHEKFSGQDLTYFDQEKDLRYHPFVIEPAAGVDRTVLAFLIDAYREEEARTAKGGTERRTYLALHTDLAPVKVAVLPLSRNEQLAPDARAVFDLVKTRWMCDFDDAGSIGRRYRRQDEVGTPMCVTVDFDTLEDRQVTVRERDTMTQERLPIENLVAYLGERL
jgi:glycyl-tRNA synthetase